MSATSGDSSVAFGRKSVGIHTVADLNRRPPTRFESDSNEAQEYYTGGEQRVFLLHFLLAEPVKI